jgi:hypothetical protein
MQQYQYQNINGYPVANIRGRQFLVDTGLPFTVAARPVLIDGERIDACDEVTGLNANSFNDLVGIGLDGILGANVTDRFVMKIRPEQGALIFDQYLDDMPMEIAVDNLAGVPSIHQTINGKHLKAFLSIGSHLSWVKADMVAGLQPVGRDRDMMGFTGEVDTPVYELPVAFGDGEHRFRFGVLPEELAAMADMANVSAVIGGELLDYYAMSLSMSEGVLLLDPVGVSVH